MEESQSAQSGKLLKYALRSGTKAAREEKAPVATESSKNSAPKRGRPASTLSKSVGILDLSGKEKSAKPPRRLSIQAKPTGTPAPKLAGNITPISEARSRRSAKSETPTAAAADVFKSTTRKKFNVLTSPSFWMTNIKASEAAGKHSISLGFFKLAVEAGCESLREELKSYVDRHELGELEEPLKEFLERKNVVENVQLQVSETVSQVPEDGTRSSDDDAKSCSSTMGSRKLKPKTLNTDAAVQVSPVKASAKKEIAPKSIPSARTRASSVRSSSNSGPVSDNVARGSAAKKAQKPSTVESNQVKDRKKKQGNKSACEKGSLNPTPAEQEALHENKENEDVVTEVVV